MFTITLIVEVLFMLRNFKSHTFYQENLKLHLLLFWKTDRSRVKDMEKSISKLYLLNLDPLLPIIQPLYSNTGCSAKNQLGIIRFLILMLDQKHHGITSWAKKVANDPLLCAICGFQYGKAPPVGFYYDFIKRLWKASHKIHVARKKKLRPFKPKPRKKLKAGQKLKLKHNGIVKKFARIAMRDALPEYRPEHIFQEFLARCVVDVPLKWVSLAMCKNFLSPVMAPHSIPVLPITVQRSVIVKNTVSTIASAPDVIPTLMQDGVAATGNSGSMAIPSLTSLLPTVPTTFPFTCVKHRHQDMTASLPFLPCLR